MSWVAAAVVGGAIIGGVASNSAAKKGAAAQRDAASQASATELEMFNQNREDLTPWREAGTETLQQIMGGLRSGGEFAKSQYRPFDMNSFHDDAGYQFRLAEGQKALERSAASKGMLGSGATMKDALRFGQGLASDEYGRAYDRYSNDYNMRTGDIDKRFNRLATVSGLGQTATGQTAQLGANAANNIASNQIGVGNANAAASIAQGNAVSNTANSLGNYMMMSKFMGK